MKDMGHLEGSTIGAPVHKTHFLKKMSEKKTDQSKRKGTSEFKKSSPRMQVIYLSLELWAGQWKLVEKTSSERNLTVLFYGNTLLDWAVNSF